MENQHEHELASIENKKNSRTQAIPLLDQA
jgi:hypothetical protein